MSIGIFEQIICTANKFFHKRGIACFLFLWENLLQAFPLAPKIILITPKHPFPPLDTVEDLCYNLR